jgi:hypothetical protein
LGQTYGIIAEHPSLRTLFFAYIFDENESLVFERHDSIHALAGMLAENEQVDEIEVTDPFDRVSRMQLSFRDSRSIRIGSGFLPSRTISRAEARIGRRGTS